MEQVSSLDLIFSLNTLKESKWDKWKNNTKGLSLSLIYLKGIGEKKGLFLETSRLVSLTLFSSETLELFVAVTE